MSMHRLRLFACAILIALLTACIDIRQSLVVEGSRAEYGAEIRLDARLAALAQRERSGRKPFCEPIQVPPEAKARGVEAEVTERTVQGELICTVRLRGPIEALLMAMDRKSGSGLGSISIERVDAVTLRIENVIDPISQSGSRAESRGLDPSIAEGLFAGKFITWTVRAPRILESNGAIAPDARSVEWSVPMGEAMKAQQRFHASLRLELTTIERVRLWFVDQWRAIRRVLRELLAD